MNQPSASKTKDVLLGVMFLAFGLLVVAFGVLTLIKGDSIVSPLVSIGAGLLGLVLTAIGGHAVYCEIRGKDY